MNYDDRLEFTDDKEAIFHFHHSIGTKIELGKNIQHDYGVDVLTKIMKFVPNDAEVIGFQGDFNTMAVFIGQLVSMYETFRSLQDLKLEK